MALVSIVPIYNLPGNPELRFSGDLLAKIYLGTVKKWSDSRIAMLNPGVKLPDLNIRVVHRDAGKGSNFVFTDFLSKSNVEFRSQVGTNASPEWPLGKEAKRGQDMVEIVASTVGAIGYVDMSFIRPSLVGHGFVENSSGQFVTATAASLESACLAGGRDGSDEFGFSIANAPGKNSYPMASFTWIYVPASNTLSKRGDALKEFLIWCLQDGQKMARDLGYAPLPDRVAAKVLAEVRSLP